VRKASHGWTAVQVASEDADRVLSDGTVDSEFQRGGCRNATSNDLTGALVRSMVSRRVDSLISA